MKNILVNKYPAGDKKSITGLCLAPEGGALAVACHDSSVKIFAAANGV